MKYGKIIEGNVVIKADDNNDYSLVEKITGNFYAYEDSKVKLKNKINTNNAEAREFAFNFNFNCFLSLGFVFADGILTKFISKKEKGNYAIYKTKRLCTEEIIYVVQEGNVFSHGSTIKEAIRDLVFKKIKDKDLSAYKNLTLNSVLSFQDCLELYHNVANSCARGIKMFIKQNNIEEKDYTVQEIIDKTKGQYNHELLVKFFEGK